MNVGAKLREARILLHSIVLLFDWPNTEGCMNYFFLPLFLVFVVPDFPFESFLDLSILFLNIINNL